MCEVALSVHILNYYQSFHSNNISESVLPEFNMLNLLVRENKHGILQNNHPNYSRPIQLVGFVD